jgi:hypothetical protein
MVSIIQGSLDIISQLIAKNCSRPATICFGAPVVPSEIDLYSTEPVTGRLNGLAVGGSNTLGFCTLIRRLDVSPCLELGGGSTSWGRPCFESWAFPTLPLFACMGHTN